MLKLSGDENNTVQCTDCMIFRRHIDRGRPVYCMLAISQLSRGYRMLRDFFQISELLFLWVFLTVSNSSASEQCNCYYNDSAFNFLLHYGKQYHLFDIFFTNQSYNSSKSQENLSLIADRYLIRDYSQSRYWYAANATILEEFQNLNITYIGDNHNVNFTTYQNRLRYGLNRNDRFYWIGVNGDPWSARITSQSSSDQYFVYFVGYGTDLHEDDQYSCNFTVSSRLSLMSEKEGFSLTSSRVQIMEKGKSFNAFWNSNIIRCPLPSPVLQELIENGTKLDKHCSGLQQGSCNEQEYLSLHFSRVTPDHKILLKDITIPRLPFLDRRSFKYTIHTFIEIVDDSMVIEWLIYYILQGVEHFYFYYNHKDFSSPYSIPETSLIKPFLDANIITLIYFPFTSPTNVHWNKVQHGAFNIHLNLFGKPFNEWTGYLDVDEFLLPAPIFRNAAMKESNEPHFSIPVLIESLTPKGSEAGIIMHSLDMDCEEGSTNYYQGGNNPHTYSRSRFRPAVTTHCFRTGAVIELVSKMFVRNSKTLIIDSPHQLYNEVDVIHGGRKYGEFRHFCKFRYTAGRVAGKKFKWNQIGHDQSLRDYTLKLLELYLGVIPDKPDMNGNDFN